jgi:drug/metabolite transporter superfamily protein YnfA
MSRAVTILVLVVAAVLEAGGDALIRSGLHATAAARLAFFALGALALFSYGYVVNRPPWEFGRLLGIYVVCFFLVAQVISWLVFKQRPTGSIVLGGAFIVVGGLILSLR